MHNLTKILAALLALVMVMGLVACGGQEESPAPAPTTENGETVPQEGIGDIGSFDLIGDTRVTISYTEEGNVAAINDQDGAECFTELVGTACAEAASKIIKAKSGPYATAFILVKQEPLTAVPDENFLQGIVTEVKLAAGDLPVILSSAADQDEQGYFSPETAKAILAAYLGNPEGAEYVASGNPLDGYYQVSAVISAISQDYTVGALYGSVELELEAGDDATAGDLEEPADPNAAPQPDEEDTSTEDTTPVDEDMGEDIPLEPSEEPTEEIG